MNITAVGIDLAKNVFSVHGVDAHGKVVLKKTVSRGKLLDCFANLPPAIIGMEACSGRTTGGAPCMPCDTTPASSPRALPQARQERRQRRRSHLRSRQPTRHALCAHQVGRAAR
jgi:hypothetical protein